MSDPQNHPLVGHPVRLLLANPITWVEEFADGSKVDRRSDFVHAIPLAIAEDGTATLKVLTHGQRMIVRDKTTKKATRAPAVTVREGVPRGDKVVDGVECWAP